MAKNIIFTDAHAPCAQELAATEAGILPGSLVKTVANGYAKSDVAATVFGNKFLVADYAFLSAGDVSDDYAVGDNVVARELTQDKGANVLVAGSQNITVLNTPLSSNGDGTLKIAATDGTEQILAYADEVINVTTAQLVRVRGA